VSLFFECVPGKHGALFSDLLHYS